MSMNPECPHCGAVDATSDPDETEHKCPLCDHKWTEPEE